MKTVTAMTLYVLANIIFAFWFSGTAIAQEAYYDAYRGDYWRHHHHHHHEYNYDLRREWPPRRDEWDWSHHHCNPAMEAAGMCE